MKLSEQIVALEQALDALRARCALLKNSSVSLLERTWPSEPERTIALVLARLGFAVNGTDARVVRALARHWPRTDASEVGRLEKELEVAQQTVEEWYVASCENADRAVEAESIGSAALEVGLKECEMLRQQVSWWEKRHAARMADVGRRIEAAVAAARSEVKEKCPQCRGSDTSLAERCPSVRKESHDEEGT